MSADPIPARSPSLPPRDRKRLVTLLRTLAPQSFADDRFGVPTVTDILRELEKPGRDPRPAFRTAAFADGVETLAQMFAQLLGQPTRAIASAAQRVR